MSSSGRAPDWDNPGTMEALAAYTALMDVLATETQHHQGKREDLDEVTRLSQIVDRAAARARTGGG